MKRLITVTAIAVLATGCSCKFGTFEVRTSLPGETNVEIARTYDESGILTETGAFNGKLSEAKGGFKMLRSDKGPAGEIVESAGADAQWTSEAGRDVLNMTMAEFFHSLRVLGALAAATQGMPAGTNITAGPPMVMNVPPAETEPTTDGRE